MKVQQKLEFGSSFERPKVNGCASTLSGLMTRCDEINSEVKAIHVFLPYYLSYEFWQPSMKFKNV